MSTICYYYKEGSRLDDYGRTVNVQRDDDSPLEKTGYENYLFIFPPDAFHTYNGIYFTRKITASPLVYYLK